MISMKFVQTLITALIICRIGEGNEDNENWANLAEQDINQNLLYEINDGIAKNVILFVGDGMGPTTVTSARIYEKGESGLFAFEKFPHIAAIKTYSADKLVPDSSSTATALFCGVKANQKTSGVDASVKVGDCLASLKKEAWQDSILKWGQDVGKSTGFVTTTRVTHATPSALYSHTAHRKWECESVMPPEARGCNDIARQLVEDLPGRNINVIMGGGRQCLQSNVSGSEADPIDTYACYSTDGRDLIKTWIDDKAGRGVKNTVVSNTEELFGADTDTEYILGIFANGHLKMEHERDKGPKGMPSLSNMTEKAIQILKKNKNGFVLVVEGGMIDFAHHRGHARQALQEVVGFNDAIERALELTKDVTKETLVIVTSDHSHSLVFSGYPSRGSKTNILDIAQNSRIDNIPYTSLLYGTGGPNNHGYKVLNGEVVRKNPVLEDTTDFKYSQQCAVVTDEVTHGGTDVLLYATGPMAHLFSRVHEQTYVAYVISYAAKMGRYRKQNNGTYRVITNTYLIPLLIICINELL